MAYIVEQNKDFDPNGAYSLVTWMKQRGEKREKCITDIKGHSREWKVPKTFQEEFHEENRENEEEATDETSVEMFSEFLKDTKSAHWRSRMNKFNK